MIGQPFRPASSRELERLERTLVAAKMFRSTDEMRAALDAEPWRVRVTDRGDVAVLSRWRDHLPVLAIDALWCAMAAIPEEVSYLRDLAGEIGLADVVSPPTPIEESGAYEAAGMHAYTIVATFVATDLAGVARAVDADVTIREARPKDIPELLGVDAACFEPFWRYDERHLRRFCETGRMAIAERRGEAVGYTLCTVDGDDGLLGRLCVTPEHRRAHVGTSLLAEAVRYVGDQGGTRVTLSTQVDNVPSQALYRSASFRDTGRRYAFLRFGTDEG